MLPTLRNDRGEALDATLHVEGCTGRDLVVIGHGVTGNKDRPFAVALAGALERAGIAALRLSFAGNGDSEGDFGACTVSKEVEDLRAVLDALSEHPLVDGGHRLAYAGHSMGAAVGVLSAARDERIRLLVSLGGMVATAEFAERKFGALVPGRDVMWDKPECPLSQAFLDDMRAIASVLPQAARVGVPWLLVHGTADDVVPPRDSRDARAAAGATAELVELEGADHVFTSPHDARMAELVADWLARRFGELG